MIDRRALLVLSYGYRIDLREIYYYKKNIYLVKQPKEHTVEAIKGFYIITINMTGTGLSC